MSAVAGIPVLLFVLKVIATLLVILSLLIFLVYALNEGASDAHFHLTILAFHIIWIIAVIWYFEMFLNYGNIVLFFSAILFACVGSGMILIDAGCENSFHEWFGMMALIMGILTWILGTIMTFTVNVNATNFVFMGLAMTTMVLASFALISGMIMDSGYSDWASCFVLVMHVFIILVYTLLALIIVVYTLYVGGGSGASAGGGGGGGGGAAAGGGSASASGNASPSGNGSGPGNDSKGG